MSGNFENPCSEASSCQCLRCTKLTECLLANPGFINAVNIAVQNPSLAKRVAKKMPTPEETVDSSTPYYPGMEFYDGGFDPTLPSNSAKFTEALAEHWRAGKEKNPQEDFYD